MDNNNYLYINTEHTSLEIQITKNYYSEQGLVYNLNFTDSCTILLKWQTPFGFNFGLNASELSWFKINVIQLLSNFIRVTSSSLAKTLQLCNCLTKMFVNVLNRSLIHCSRCIGLACANADDKYGTHIETAKIQILNKINCHQITWNTVEWEIKLTKCQRLLGIYGAHLNYK